MCFDSSGRDWAGFHSKAGLKLGYYSAAQGDLRKSSPSEVSTYLSAPCSTRQQTTTSSFPA